MKNSDCESSDSENGACGSNDLPRPKSNVRAESNDRSRGSARMCSTCHTIGHNKRTCPLKKQKSNSLDGLTSNSKNNSKNNNLSKKSQAASSGEPIPSSDDATLDHASTTENPSENGFSRPGVIPASAWHWLDTMFPTDQEFINFFKNDFRTTKITPKQIRMQFRHAASAIFSFGHEAQSSEDEIRAWKAVLLLPIMLLRRTKNSGKAGKAQQRARFTNFWHGAWDKLLEINSNVPNKNKQKAPQSLSTIHQQVIQLVEQGQLSKAMTRLSPVPFAPDCDATITKLQSLHPICEQPIKLPPISPDTPFPEVSMQHIIEALSSAPRNSAAGITGWTYDHLRYLLPHDGGDSHPLSWFIEQLINGKAPPLVVKTLSTSRLFALAKADNGVRPIAIGDTIRRWATRSICIAYKSKWEKTLGHHQFAVGTSSGTEKMIRNVDSFLQMDEKHVVVSLDASNAFNSANRQSMLNELAKEFPELVPFFGGWYGAPAELWYAHQNAPPSIILSHQGVQQGDAAGPFLFSLGLRPILSEIQKVCPSGLVAAYLDDISLGASHENIGEFVSKAEESLKKYELKLNHSKCKAWSRSWLSSPAIPDLPNLPSMIKRCEEGFSLLGRPFGKPKYIKDELDATMGNIEKGLKALADLPNPQVAFILLRCCASAKANHLCRLLPLSNKEFIDAVKRHDRAVQSCAEKILCIPSLPPEGATYRQLSLPLREGGFGIRRLEKIGDAAFYGSAGVTIHDVIMRMKKRGESVFDDGECREEGKPGLDKIHDDVDVYNEILDRKCVNIRKQVLDLPWVKEVEAAHSNLIRGGGGWGGRSIAFCI